MHSLKCLPTYGSIRVVPTPRGNSQRACPAGAVTEIGEYSPDMGLGISAPIGTKLIITEKGKQPMTFYVEPYFALYTFEVVSFVSIDTTGVGIAYVWTPDLSTLRDQGDGTT